MAEPTLDDHERDTFAGHLNGVRVPELVRGESAAYVDGAVWGVNAAATEEGAFPADAEERLARFTDLVATSVQNATMRDQLAASRARVIAAADESRRRIERDLHDGAQQQLVTLALDLRRAAAKIPSGLDELRADLGHVAQGLTDALQELREMSRGIHPAVLTLGGLSPALQALGRRANIRSSLTSTASAVSPSRSRRPPTTSSPRRSRTPQSTQPLRVRGSPSVWRRARSISRFEMTALAERIRLEAPG